MTAFEEHVAERYRAGELPMPERLARWQPPWWEKVGLAVKQRLGLHWNTAPPEQREKVKKPLEAERRLWSGRAAVQPRWAPAGGQGFMVTAERLDEEGEAVGEPVRLEVQEGPMITAGGRFVAALRTEDPTLEGSLVAATLEAFGQRISFTAVIANGEARFAEEGLPGGDHDVPVPLEEGTIRWSVLPA
jgi:hypothetical protein